MRDKRFVRDYRGGSLKVEQHQQLIQWAYDCSNHILYLFGENIDYRLINALNMAIKWKQGNVTVGECRKTSLGAIEVARKCSNPVQIAVARSVGHNVATAHMADHSLGAAWYALKAVKNAGKSVDKERKWQNKQLPLEIKEIIITGRKNKRFQRI